MRMYWKFSPIFSYDTVILKKIGIQNHLELKIVSSHVYTCGTIEAHENFFLFIVSVSYLKGNEEKWEEKKIEERKEKSLSSTLFH